LPTALAWDLWLAGTRPRSFKRFAYHRFNWRGWVDFGSGALGDIGSQLLSFPYDALALDAPERIERLHAVAGSAASYPQSSEVRFVCRSALLKNRVEIFWYDGTRLPHAGVLQQVQATLGRIPGTGVLLMGAKGSWLSTGSDCSQHYIGLNGSARMTDLEKHDLWVSAPKYLPRTGSREDYFLQAVRSGEEYDFNQSAQAALTKAILTGALAQRMGGALNWRDRKGRFSDNDAANRLLAPNLQPGWEYF
jgi:hypothetical protein